MARATITVHLPSHRSRALQLEQNTAEAIEAYDANIGDYLKFLKDEASRHDYAVKTDNTDFEGVFSINDTDHAGKKTAHDWLETQPDVWNWIP
ncbi:MAG: hypothetical protein JWQ90_900 [Hydrocarboniphaga sp.]|uniref:hypothetical protein n=1 Tax=Hydrocarboniphaga sp. TaxID=2033016 RepID=UPI0026376F6A|nr:hypothetical protein [Hydrocarboniphaga sp.]MDB5968450.1 hypothetical protein [Hydrocarboniphaga sp.]